MRSQLVVDKSGNIKAVATLKVKVTKDDILYGELGSTSRCAIALAVKRACGNEYADVGVSGAGINIGNFQRAAGVQKKLDKQLETFVNKFDSLEADEAKGIGRAQAAKRAGVKPFSFELVLEKGMDVKVPQLCKA